MNTQSTPPFLFVRNVKKSFTTTEVLRGVNFSLQAGEQCVIRGASGSGKSTLLYLIGGLEAVSAGEIIVDGRPIHQWGDEGLALYRNQTVGFVFQFHYLLPAMNCFDNMLLPARIHRSVSEKEVKNHVLELCHLLEVEHCLQKYPYQISGGEQQRINVIRALSLKPKLLLCDEPTGNLDSKNSMKVAEMIKNLALKYQSTLILVTHDKNVAGHFEREVIMEDGTLKSLPSIS